MTDPVVHRILAFVEFAAKGGPELGYAISLAAQLKAELILFGVIDTPSMVALIARHRARQKPVVGATLTEAMVGDAKDILQELVDQAEEAGVRARGHATVSEEVPEQILKEAIVQEVDLILIPPGETGFLERLMGSTVEEVLDAAPCPVLVGAKHPKRG
ncbi:MAG: universal stress protein [Planctomycetota bacterium]